MRIVRASPVRRDEYPNFVNSSPPRPNRDRAAEPDHRGIYFIIITTRIHRGDNDDVFSLKI